MFVVVAFDGRTIHIANDVYAFVRIGVVTDHVAQADVMRAIVLLGVGCDRFESLEVGVDVAKNGKAHGGASSALVWGRSVGLYKNFRRWTAAPEEI